MEAQTRRKEFEELDVVSSELEKCLALCPVLSVIFNLVQPFGKGVEGDGRVLGGVLLLQRVVHTPCKIHSVSPDIPDTRMRHVYETRI